LTLAALSLAASLSQAAVARAQSGDEALAEELFREGKALMKAGRYEEACPKLAESNRVDAATGTRLALALCHERQGRTATAWAEYSEVAATAAREGNAERSRVAQGRIAELEPRLSKLSVVVSAQVASLPGLRITRDGSPMGEPTWGSAVPVDPGDHVIQVTADHKKPLSRSVRIGPAAQQTVTVAAMDDDAVTTTAPATLGPSGPSPATRGEARTDSAPAERPIPVSVYVAAGVGVLALASFAYFGLTGRAEYFDSKASCGPGCSKSDVAGTHTKLVVADVSLGVSVVALGAGAYLFLTRPEAAASADSTRARPLRVDVRASAHAAGASLGLAF
jgi:hypothetical protein